MKVNRLFGLAAISLVLCFSCSKQVDSVNNDAAAKGVDKMPSADHVKIAADKKAQSDREKAKLPKPYNEKEDAAAKIVNLIKVAKAENKNIILQAGGNWCIWCLRFNNYIQTTPELKELVDANYLYYHLNYSPDNKNEKVFAQYGNPGEKFGYPVFIILDKNGTLIHTQDSALLEEGKGYSLEKVKAFFNKWKPQS